MATEAHDEAQLIIKFGQPEAAAEKWARGPSGPRSQLPSKSGSSVRLLCLNPGGKEASAEHWESGEGTHPSDTRESRPPWDTS